MRPLPRRTEDAAASQEMTVRELQVLKFAVMIFLTAHWVVWPAPTPTLTQLNLTQVITQSAPPRTIGALPPPVIDLIPCGEIKATSAASVGKGNPSRGRSAASSSLSPATTASTPTPGCVAPLARTRTFDIAPSSAIPRRAPRPHAEHCGQPWRQGRALRRSRAGLRVRSVLRAVRWTWTRPPMHFC